MIIKVLKARSEGMGFNAVCRVFEISKNTLLAWERRLADLKGRLLIYVLLHTFLTQLIEGDEIYTKVGKNVPADTSEGWTIVLMERASRFIWALECGKKDRELFLSAIQLLSNIISRTGDVTLVTDGERRYSLLLFEICQEVFRSGRRGRPRRVLRSGVRVRLKNKGSQSRLLNLANFNQHLFMHESCPCNPCRVRPTHHYRSSKGPGCWCVGRTLQSLPTITITLSRLNLISVAKLHEENPKELVQIQHPSMHLLSGFQRCWSRDVCVVARFTGVATWLKV